MVKTTTKPLQALTDHLRRVRETGRYWRQPIAVSGAKEIRELATCFNGMSGELAQANQELLQESPYASRPKTNCAPTRTSWRTGGNAHQGSGGGADEALQASQTKSAFIANVSHEIRTPLTPIIGFAESMLQDNPDAETRNSIAEFHHQEWAAPVQHHQRNPRSVEIERTSWKSRKIDVDVSQLYRDIDSVIGALARDKGLEFHRASPTRCRGTSIATRRASGRS